MPNPEIMYKIIKEISFKFEHRKTLSMEGFVMIALISRQRDRNKGFVRVSKYSSSKDLMNLEKLGFLKKTF